nr:PREDICTED: ATP-binding cassette sub-family E member 1-like [Paralichthys olivaceus]
MADKNTRIAIVSHDKCKPKKCRQECKKSCPVVRMGKLCIEVTPQSKIVWISESLCIGCGICIKKCPFGALSIVNLPSNLEKETTHRYCANSFKLHRYAAALTSTRERRDFLCMMRNMLGIEKWNENILESWT